MIQDEFGRYQQELVAKQAELELLLRTLDSIAVQYTADELDNVQLSGEREVAINSLERWTALLDEVHEALDRITTGNYGVCLSCQEAINSRRLMAVPWTAYCLRCQMVVDRLIQQARADTQMRSSSAEERGYSVRRPRKTLAVGG